MCSFLSFAANVNEAITGAADKLNGDVASDLSEMRYGRAFEVSSLACVLILLYFLILLLLNRKLD